MDDKILPFRRPLVLNLTGKILYQDEHVIVARITVGDSITHVVADLRTQQTHSF